MDFQLCGLDHVGGKQQFWTLFGQRTQEPSGRCFEWGLQQEIGAAVFSFLFYERGKGIEPKPSGALPICSKPPRTSLLTQDLSRTRAIGVFQPTKSGLNPTTKRNKGDPPSLKIHQGFYLDPGLAFGQRHCGIKGFLPTSVIQGNLLFLWQVCLWEALFVVSQKWSFPTALGQRHPPHLFGPFSGATNFERATFRFLLVLLFWSIFSQGLPV